ncbi:hypothetical protein [Haloflavibacter putidus]|uniref:Uncharacterized protein n=1 Tax=Haloflavibacter putidus TaxID=2576776 RepID=A0A507ZVZ8_9FLAO|nr:hypothetical protein [Haloflavibacter putidus]TQD40653.1 hypothetical protein FKR84_01345 [Haloflavibacter putidus]
MYFLFFQTEIPRPEDTKPGQEYGLFTFQEFIIANWGYISIVLIVALIVLLYTRSKKRPKRDQ